MSGSGGFGRARRAMSIFAVRHESHALGRLDSPNRIKNKSRLAGIRPGYQTT